ncbi:MAG: hypothetical protein AB1439_10825 [candidate division FCPU426 bacterium]
MVLRKRQSSITLLLSLLLVIPPGTLQAKSQPEPTEPSTRPERLTPEIVVLVPDVLDSAKTLANARQRLIKRGLKSRDVVVTAEQPGFSRSGGLDQQARQLEKILIDLKIRQPSARLHVVGKGSGGLVVRQYLARQAGLGPQAVTVESAVGLGVPHHGRWWAGVASSLGAKSQALADLAPGSAFLNQLNQPIEARRAEVRRVQGVLASLRQPNLRAQVRGKLSAIESQQADIRESVERALHFPQRAALSPDDQKRRQEAERFKAKLNRLPAAEARHQAASLAAASQRQVLAAEKFAGQSLPWQAPARQSTRTAEEALVRAQQTLLEKLSQPQAKLPAGFQPPKTQAQPGQWLSVLQALEHSSQAAAEKAASQAGGLQKQFASLDFEGLEARLKNAGTEAAGRLPADLLQLKPQHMARDLERAARKYETAAALEAAWRQSQAGKEQWLDQVERLTQVAAKQQLARDLAAYAAKAGLAPARLRAGAAEAGDLPERAQAAYRAWRQKEAALDQAFAAAKEQGLETIVKPEFWKLRERTAQVAERTHQAIARDSLKAWEGLAALRLGPAAKEQAMFAQATEHRLNRELAAWKQELLKPDWEARFSQAASALNRSLPAAEQAGALKQALVQQAGALQSALAAVRSDLAARERQSAWERLAADSRQAAAQLLQQQADHGFVADALAAGNFLAAGRKQEQQRLLDLVRQNDPAASRQVAVLAQLALQRHGLQSRLLETGGLDAGPAPQLLERIAGQAKALGLKTALPPKAMEHLAQAQEERQNRWKQLNTSWKRQWSQAVQEDRERNQPAKAWSACQETVAVSRSLAVLEDCSAALSQMKSWRDMGTQASGQQGRCQVLEQQLSAWLQTSGLGSRIPAVQSAAAAAQEKFAPAAWQAILSQCGQKQEQASARLQNLRRELARQPEWILPQVAGVSEQLAQAAQDPSRIKGLLLEISGLREQTQKHLTQAREQTLEALWPGQGKGKASALGQELNQVLSSLQDYRQLSRMNAQADTLQDLLSAKALLWQQQNLQAQGLGAVKTLESLLAQTAGIPGKPSGQVFSQITATLSLMQKLTANQMQSAGLLPGLMDRECGMPAKAALQKEWRAWLDGQFSAQQGLDWAGGQLQLSTVLSNPGAGWRQQTNALATGMLENLVDQAAERQISLGLAEVQRLSNEARELLSAPVRQLRAELGQLGLLDPRQDQGPGLSIVSWAQHFVQQGVAQGVAQALASLERTQAQFSNRLERGLLELARAQATMAINALSGQYAGLAVEVKRLWEGVGPEAGEALNLQGLLNVAQDQEFLQTWQEDIFSKLVAENPLQADLGRLGQVASSLQALIDQPASQLGDWLVRSGVNLGVERLQSLQAEAQKLLHEAMTTGAVNELRTRLNAVLLKLDQEAGRLSRYLDQTLAKLPSGVVPAGLRDALRELRDLPGTLAAGIDGLMQDVESYLANQVLQSGFDRLNAMLNQYGGQASLWAVGARLQLSLTEISSLGQTAVAQLEVSLADLGTGNLTGLWENVAAGLSDFGGNLLNLLQDFVASASPVDLGGFLNITGLADSLWASAGEVLGQFTGLFELQVPMAGDWWQADELWQQLSGIFNAENWQLDFYQAADGFLRNISENLENLLNSGLAWVNDRWTEYMNQAREYWDILAGGPGRWWDELASGRWDQSLGNLMTQYLPPEYQPAVSALQQVRLAFNADFQLSAEWITNILDNLSAYLSEDARAVYQQVRELYDTGSEYYSAGSDILNAISSGDVTSVLTNISRLGRFHFNTGGQMYQWGKGRANKKGKYDGQALSAASEEEVLAAYVNALPASMREQALRMLENGTLPGSNPEREIDVADYDPDVDGQPAGPAAYEAAQEADASATLPDVAAASASDRHPGVPEAGVQEQTPPRRSPSLPKRGRGELDSGLGGNDSQGSTTDEGDASAAGTQPGGEGESGPPDLGPPRMSGVPTPPPVKQSLLDKMKNVYTNLNPVGLSKNAAQAAAPDGAKKVSKKAKEALKKAADKTATMAKNAKDNLGMTVDAFNNTKGLDKKTRIAQGVGTGVLSGDLLDNPDPASSEFDPDGPAILYINGMRTPNDKAEKDQKALFDKCGYKVARVQNNSSLEGAGDIAQIAGQEQGNIDITAIRTAAMIRKGLENRDEIYVVAHSQGTKTFEQALALLTPEERKKIKFQGFGGEQYIDKNKYGLASARNVRHEKDPVPKVNDARIGNKDWETLGHQPEVKPGTEPGILDYHDFRKTYVDSVELPVNTNATRKEDDQ